MPKPTRRALLAAGLSGLAAPALAQPQPRLQVWRDPGCGCCGGWIAQMRAAGFAAEEIRTSSLSAIRRQLGIPSDLLSCHPAMAGGFALEGHVPGLAARRLLAERPASLRGLAVPAMPVGAPGMEVPGHPPETYDVIAFGQGPHRAFMRFRGGEAVS